MTIETNEIFKEFEAADAILRGHFILSSGLHSDTYLQCARVLMNTQRADRLCGEVAEKLDKAFGKEAFDIVVAPAMGGVVVGYEIGRQLKLPTIFCEREGGEFTFRRGFTIPKGARVLIVEDVVTTGKSSLETVSCIEAHGGVVIAEACLVDRSANGSNPLGEIPLISLLKVEVNIFESNSVPENLKNTPAVKPGSRWIKTEKRYNNQ